MSPTTTERAENPFGLRYWVFVVLLVAHIVVDLWMPGSAAATVVSYAFICSSMVWFGHRIGAGYQRRRPYWTRESWLRFGRLAAMPVAATVFVLAMSTETGMSLMGPARSISRNVWATVLVVMLLLGAFGLAAVVEWLFKGDPSQQFTRTRWLPGRGTSTPTQ